ncbi:hypothetical protein E3P99_03980 [Wallemia hederae]|uniref:26S proteasome regulatory subunit 7 homolog n=1 Tax=Wallemia hederae TaxID=1540922 RepID=A0A4T0FBS8_9BASI|nr:hypothetical protein E3P99_03980 [Wallemia hederae]
MSDRLLKLVLRNYLSSPDEHSAAAAIQFLQSEPQVFDLNRSFELLTQLNTRIITLLQSRAQLDRSLGLQLAILWTNERISSLDCIRQFGKQWIEKSIAVVNRANDDKSTLKNALRLTTLIFNAATRLPEFSRAVTQPLAVKYAQKLLNLIETRKDIQIEAIDAASDHLLTHSSSFRPHINILNGTLASLLASAPDHSRKSYIDAIARLYATSPRAAGKANVAQSLKKHIESTLKSIESDVHALQGDVFGQSLRGEDLKLNKSRAVSGDLLVDAPFLIKRVGVLSYAICKALSTANDTFVSIPVGAIVGLCSRILQLTPATIKENSSKEEAVLRINSMVPLISYTSGLLSQLSGLVGMALSPHVNTILNAVAFHLSSAELNGHIKHSLITLTTHLTASGAAFNVDNVHMNRIFKAALRSLTLASPSKSAAAAPSAPSKSSSKGKKRSRHQFEADEAFSASTRLTALDVNVLVASIKSIESALHTQPSMETLALKAVVALSLDQDWRLLMPSHAAAERVWEAMRSVISSKRALTTPMSSWIVNVTGSSDVLDTLIHPAAPPPVVHADIDDKRVNIKKELQNIKLALGIVGSSADEAAEEEEGDEGGSDKEQNEDEDMQDDDAAEEQEVASEVKAEESPQKQQQQHPEAPPASTASANGQLDFAVSKEEPERIQSITTARPPPVESSKSFTNPIATRSVQVIDILLFDYNLVDYVGVSLSYTQPSEMPPKADWEKYRADPAKKDEGKIEALDDTDIQILKTYGQGPYARQLKKAETDIKEVQKRVNERMGIKESDTGLAPPNLWDLPADRQRMESEHPLQVARCTKIIRPHQIAQQQQAAQNAQNGEEQQSEQQRPQQPSIPLTQRMAQAGQGVLGAGTSAEQAGGEGDDKYVIDIKHVAKFVVGLGDRIAPTDVEEGMRVGVDRQKYQIQIPLPPRIDPTVTMMQVEEKPDITYSDVGGCKEQIDKLREVVELPLLNPERFEKLGIDPPKGVLLYGPPGTGKTLCARAVANRTDSTFIRVIGSELVQRYVGEGARMVRELFEMARSKRACIIFFDEVDAIGGARFDDGAGGDNEVQRTMLELINQLDGFDSRGNIKVLMATNRPDTLDPALLRPGRLDRRVEFNLPDNQGRAHILKIHARSMSCERNIRFELIARLCPNATGAELRSVATEAGMFAIRARRKVASEKDFLDSVDKVIRQGTKFSSTGQYMQYN